MAEKMKPSGIDWIGDIPNEWDITKVKYRTSQIGSGTTPDSGNPLYYEDGYFPWIQSGDLYNADYIRDTEKKITELAVADFNALTWYEKEFVVVAMYGASVGNIAISQISSYTNQACCVLKAKDDDLRYLFYFLSAGKENMLQMAFGGTQPNISQAIIKNLPYLDVSHNEQQAIADFLDKECAQIDSIATDLEKQIELLQQYKKSLITETVTKGLDKSVPMKDSGVEWIGQIPEHWDVEPIKYRVTFHNGDRGENYPTKSELQSEGIPFINAGHLEGGGLNMANMDYISEEKYRIMGGVKLRSGDILYCLRGSVGKNAIVDMDQGTVASSLVAIRSVRISAEYLYYCLNSHIEEVQRYWWDNGTAQPNLSADNLGKYKICIPPVEEQKAIVKYLNNICSQIDNLIIGKKKQLSTIQQHKKSLIYEYVTGKKRVKEVR